MYDLYMGQSKAQKKHGLLLILKEIQEWNGQGYMKSIVVLYFMQKQIIYFLHKI